MALISCSSASFGYDGSVAVDGLDFEVGAGDYLCIVGDNGAGKSTLVKGLLGLMRPVAGSVRYGDGLRQSEIGYLPQRTPAQQDFPASVSEIVLSGFLGQNGARPFFTRGQRQEARRSLELMGAAHLGGRCFRELSGGQQQRVLLARALCASQRLILLDEPVAGLDPTATGSLYGLIDHVNHAMGIAVIMVSHDRHCVTGHASHVLHLQQHQLFFGTREEYLATDLGRSFLGHFAEGDARSLGHFAEGDAQ